MEPERQDRWETAPSMLTTKTAAEFLHVSEDLIQELAKQRAVRQEHGTLDPNPFPVVRLGTRILIPLDELREWVRREAGWAQSIETPEPVGGALPVTRPVRDLTAR